MHPSSRRSCPLPDLTQIQYIRQEMPATTAHIYLNTGTFCPLPACAIQAMQERIQAEWRDGRLGAAFFESLANIYKNARSSVAHLLNADAEVVVRTRRNWRVVCAQRVPPPHRSHLCRLLVR